MRCFHQILICQIPSVNDLYGLAPRRTLALNRGMAHPAIPNLVEGSCIESCMAHPAIPISVEASV